MADKTDYQCNQILTDVKNLPPYAALFTTLPDPGGANGVEVSAASYIRKEVTFGDIGDPSGGGRDMFNSAEIAFDEAEEPWGTVVGFGIADAETTGNLLYFAVFDGSATYPILTGQQFKFPAETVRLWEK